MTPVRRNMMRSNSKPRNVVNVPPWRSWGTSIVVLAVGVVALGVSLMPFSAARTYTPPFPPDFNMLEPVLRERIEAAASLARDQPDNADRYGHLGLIYHAHGYLALASECYDRARRVDDANPRWRHHWAVLAATLGQVEEASVAFQEVIALEPDYAPAHEWLGRLSLDVGDIDAALRAFEHVVQLRPQEAASWNGLARVKLRQERFSEVVEILVPARALWGNHEETNYLLGRAYRGLGQMAEAQVAMALGGSVQPASLRDPWLEEMKKVRVTRWLRRTEARQLLGEGRTKEARAMFEAILADYPGRVDLMNDLASAYMADKLDEEALVLLERALKLDSEFGLTHLHLASVLAKRGRHAEAVGHAQAAVKKLPRNIRASIVHARLLMKLKRFDDTVIAWGRVLNLDSTSVDAFTAIGLACVQLHRWDDGIDAFEKAVSLEPDLSVNLLRLGVLYDRVGRVDDGIKVLHRVLELDPHNEAAQRTLTKLQQDNTGG